MSGCARRDMVGVTNEWLRSKRDSRGLTRVGSCTQTDMAGVMDERWCSNRNSGGAPSHVNTSGVSGGSDGTGTVVPSRHH
jgi:hypothetical protein